MLSGFNKRGQEGLTLGTLLILIIGVVAVVFLILFFTGTLDKLFEKTEALPGNLEAVSQACKISAGASLVTDYCYTFKKISDEEYVNCEDRRIQDALKQQNSLPSFKCDVELVGDAKVQLCEGIIDNKRAKVRVISGTETGGSVACSAVMASTEGPVQ